ncbi:MAG: thioredoxin family protein [Anaerolineae bacterium]
MRRPNVIVPITLIVLLLAVLFTASGVAAQSGGQTIIYFFWGDGCPHCAAAKPFLARLAQQYPGVQIRDFEVWDHPENRDPFIKLAAKFGFEPTAVPTIFIGERYWVGYADVPIGREIEAYVASCALSGCPDAGAGVPGLAPAAPTRSAVPTLAPPTLVPTAPARTQSLRSASAAPADPPPAAAANRSPVRAWSVRPMNSAAAKAAASEIARPYQKAGPQIRTKGACTRRNRGGSPVIV